MKLSQFNFKLPEAQVALYPHKTKRIVKTSTGEERTFEVTRRDEARMMVLHKKSETIDMYRKDANGNPIEGEFIEFKDIVNYFDEGDTFVFNNTKVFPARLYGTKEKTDAKIEVFLLRELNPEMRLWDVLVEPARKIRIGNKLFFDDVNEMVAEVIDNTTSRGRTLRFLYDEDGNHDVFKRSLFALGEAPLPRYVIDAREDHHATEDDMEDFQCVFAEVARISGSVSSSWAWAQSSSACCQARKAAAMGVSSFCSRLRRVSISRSAYIAGSDSWRSTWSSRRAMACNFSSIRTPYCSSR